MRHVSPYHHVGCRGGALDRGRWSEVHGRGFEVEAAAHAARQWYLPRLNLACETEANISPDVKLAPILTYSDSRYPWCQRANSGQWSKT